MTAQAAPSELQRSHSTVIVSGADPDHAPELALMVWPNCAEPASDGASTFAGGCNDDWI
jgi:hypothetical protein